MPDWLLQLLTSATVTAVSLWVVQSYFLSKVKHDFDLKLEKIKPLTAEETLRRQNYLNSKREVFIEAARMVCRHLEAADWAGPQAPNDRVQSGTKPTEMEINLCLAKLAIYSDDPKIVREFMTCFEFTSAYSLGQFLERLRLDLGYGKLAVTPEKYVYAFARNSKTQPSVSPNPRTSGPVD